MSPKPDPFVDLPQHVKQEIEVRQLGAAKSAVEQPQLTKVEQLLAEAYERRIQADRVMVEADIARSNLLREADALVAQAEDERRRALEGEELRAEAERLAANARSGLGT